MSATGAKWWIDDLTDVCVQFQIDLSCLVDGELDEAAAGRAIAHLEECSLCSDFFQDTRDQVRAHKDLIRVGSGDVADLAETEAPDLLLRYHTLVGAELDEEIETIELTTKLSTLFYQLGKAYVLAEVDPGFRVRVFEKAVHVGETKTRGRGFVDGVLSSGRGSTGGVDWSDARHLLNGKLERIESPLVKGRRLLEEALTVDPTHEEARLYLAYLDDREGKKLRAAKSYRQIFRTAVHAPNRGHAASRLGTLYAGEGEYRKAIACYRWIIQSGLADQDDRFFYARFNVGINYAQLRDRERSLRAFRALIDHHPEKRNEIVRLFLRSEATRTVIDLQPGFAEALLSTCPELFVLPEEDSDPGFGSEEDPS